MAYLAFNEISPAPAYAAPAWPAARSEATTARLGPLEWSVVALARGDSLASLRSPGRLSMALGNLFGRRPNPSLADPRLEALRRMAVLSWHHGFAVPAREVKAFLAAGFSPDQYETLLASISAGRMARGARA